MKESKEYFNNEIAEKHKELNRLKNDNSFKDGELSRIVGWLLVVMILVTILYGGVSNGAEGLSLSFVTIALVFYYIKLKHEDGELNSKTNNYSIKLEELKNKRKEIYDDVEINQENNFCESNFNPHKLSAAPIRDVVLVISKIHFENNKKSDINQLAMSAAYGQDKVELARKKQIEKRIDMQSALLKKEDIYATKK